MWEQTLSGLIKALRSNKADEKRVIQQALSEIASEVKSTDLDLKAAAILKLCYLDMLGYPQLSFYSFNVVECMSSNKLHIKQIGYLAASQSFGPNTEVSMLTTNLVKKDLVSHSKHPMSFFNFGHNNLTSNAPVLCLALSSLPNLLNSQNSADLSSDLVSMLNHSKPTIRKRAVTVIHTLASVDMLRMMEDQRDLGQDQYTAPADPASRQVMDLWVERFREKLLDDDMGVVNSAVNVICELALRCPWPWLELAAELYDLLKLKNNNWMMIKIVKIFTVLTPIEPRLTKKLLPALSDLISTTKAMSLLYESIHTVLASGMLTHAISAEESRKLAKTCIDKLADFLDHFDHNLRYMALVGLTKLVPSHPELLGDYLTTILELVHEVDPMLTTRALDLLEGIQYHPHTLQNTVDFLINALEGQKPRAASDGIEQSDAVRALLSIQIPSKTSRSSNALAPHQKLRIVNVIINICSKSSYSQIPDFQWFLQILIRLIRLLVSPRSQGTYRESFSAQADGSSAVTRLANVLLDVTSRVRDIRPNAVNDMLSLLHDDTLLSEVSNDHCSSIYTESTVPNLFEAGIEVTKSSCNLVTAAIWICGEYSDGEYVDLEDLISTLFKRQLILDQCKRLPQISMFSLHNGLKVFVKWLRELVGQWYPCTRSDQSCKRIQASFTDEWSHGQSSGRSPLDAQLIQLNRLLSAIIDRTSELVTQREIWASCNFFPTVDHSRLLDHANEVAGIMELIRRELIGFQPPQPNLETSQEDRAHGSESHQSMFYGLGTFGEVNPFATNSGSPHDGFRAERKDSISGHDRAATSLELPPPFWFEILSNLFFIYELKPVANSAQAMIQPPDELELQSWMAHLKHISAPSDPHQELDEFGRKIGEDFRNPYQKNANQLLFDEESSERKTVGESLRKRGKKKRVPVDQEALKQVKRDRLERQQADPFYIKPTSKKNKNKRPDEINSFQSQTATDLLDIDNIPIVRLDLSVSPSDSSLPIPSSSTGPMNLIRPNNLLRQPSSVASFSSHASFRPLVIDVEGEVPDLSYLKKHKNDLEDRFLLSASTSRIITTDDLEAKSKSDPSSPYSHDNNMNESVVVSQPPRSIKVVKKKQASSSKKKKGQIKLSHE